MKNPHIDTLERQFESLLVEISSYKSEYGKKYPSARTNQIQKLRLKPFMQMILTVFKDQELRIQELEAALQEK